MATSLHDGIQRDKEFWRRLLQTKSNTSRGNLYRKGRKMGLKIQLIRPELLETVRLPSESETLGWRMICCAVSLKRERDRKPWPTAELGKRFFHSLPCGLRVALSPSPLGFMLYYKLGLTARWVFLSPSKLQPPVSAKAAVCLLFWSLAPWQQPHPWMANSGKAG